MISQEEEKHGLLRMHIDSTDSSSIRSFASSSTLTSSPILSSQDEEKDFNSESSSSSSSYSPIHPQQPLPWQKTPLTIRGLSCLSLRILITILKPLLPSFLQPTTSSTKPRKIHSTSYLDGLRGVAALIVFLDHFVLNWFYTLRNGYLSSPTDSYILQLPILRLIFAGRASVSIFFVISGFVLSHKSLRQIHSSSPNDMFITLSSSLFRRAIRLFLPIIAGTFISALLANYQLYTPTPSRNELIPPVLPTLNEQLWNWWSTILELIYPFQSIDPNNPRGTLYNGHLWTIPIEFCGSISVFTVLLATSRLKTFYRMTGITSLAIWSISLGRWDIFSFLSGIILAELSILLQPEEELQSYYIPELHSETSTSQSRFSRLQKNPLLRISAKLLKLLIHTLRPLKTVKKYIPIPMLALSLYLLSYAGESPSPGLYHLPLVPLTPTLYLPFSLGAEHFHLTLGSFLLLLSLLLSPTLQKPFTTRFPQYLGDISYSLYIIHGMVLFTLGTGMQEKYTGQVGTVEWVDDGNGALVEAVVRVAREEGVYWRVFLAAGVVMGVLVFWAADLFWRGVDGWAVRVGRGVEGRMVRKRR